MLSKTEFDIVKTLHTERVLSQRDIASLTGLSLGNVNSTCKSLTEQGLINKSYCLTSAGKKALEPYKVDNAIIMAAGFSSRFAPISYDRPKGTLVVHGEVLIERQIKQLQAAGISDITVVVGYMKECFFYLEDKFGIKIRVNEEYAQRNNSSTIHLVKDILANTYICSSDDYFTQNVFEPYVYQSYYAAVFFEGTTDEYCIKTGPHNKIVDVTIGGHNSYGMLGHAYWDRSFSQTYTKMLNEVYSLPTTASKLWEDLYIEHIDKFNMVMKSYEPNLIYEFDSLAELQEFDPDFITNVDSHIFDNICEILKVNRADINNIEPIKQGLTNLSFSFTVNSNRYVYRHPGVGTDEIINRKSETYTQRVAAKLGIDDTYIYEDEVLGWKISRYIDNCIPFDSKDPQHLSRALELIKRLHDSGEISKWTFDLMEKCEELLNLLSSSPQLQFQDFEELQALAVKLYKLTLQDEVKPCLCHIDFYDDNILIRDDIIYLIDWEYSATADYGVDLGTFICCSDYNLEEAKSLINLYFDGSPTDEQMRHCMSYTAVASYHWFLWALYKEATGDPVGEWLYLWYRSMKTFGTYALSLYEG